MIFEYPSVSVTLMDLAKGLMKIYLDSFDQKINIQFEEPFSTPSYHTFSLNILYIFCSSFDGFCFGIDIGCGGSSAVL